MGNYPTVSNTLEFEVPSFNEIENELFIVNLKIHKIPFAFCIKCDEKNFKMCLICKNFEVSKWKIYVEVKMLLTNFDNEVMFTSDCNKFHFSLGENLIDKYKTSEVLCPFNMDKRKQPFTVQLQFSTIKVFREGNKFEDIVELMKVMRLIYLKLFFISSLYHRIFNHKTSSCRIKMRFYSLKSKITKRKTID